MLLKQVYIRQIGVDDKEEEAIRITKIARMLLKVLKKTYQIQGYSIMQNGGVFNEIGHYHYHLFPRYEGDGVGWTFGEIQPKDIKEEGKRLANEVKQLLEKE